MKINIETKYSIDDEVYIIQPEYIYNDWNYDDTEWRVAKGDYGKREYIKFKIKRIIIEQYSKGFDIFYVIDNLKVREENVFYNLDKAIKKCEELNVKLC